jgi:ABC-2 type transport system permease protein
MTDLFAADLQRILWRPFTRALGLVVVIAVAITGITVFVKSGGRHPFDTVTALPASFDAAAILLTLAGFVLGATLFGADYSSRALTTLLTWEPRRPLVLAARAVSCAAVAVSASLAALALLCVALLPAALAHGSGAVPTGSWYLSMAGLALRCALLAAGAAAIGVACAAIGRSTAAALAIIALYWIAIERTAIGIGQWLSRWLFIALAQSWMTADVSSGGGSSRGQGAGHTIVTSGLLLLAAVVVLHALATWMLGRRDIA